MRTRWFSILLIVGLIVCSLQTIEVTSNGLELPESGPYIDKIVYVVIPDPGLRLLALQAGTVDMDLTFVDSSIVLNSLENPDIDFYTPPRNGYGQITFNCRKYPLNITGFRRAFAYALDKENVAHEQLKGFYRMHDSLVPYANPFCIEEDLNWHWYGTGGLPDIGNALLDGLNFEINTDTGFRDAPNGKPFSIDIGYAGFENDQVAFIAANTLNDLHINVSNVQSYPFWKKLYSPFDDFNMVVNDRDFPDYDIRWLVSEYSSENTDNSKINPSGFSNSTYDNWGQKLLHSTSYEEVFEAAAEMQRILNYEVPSIVSYQNLYVQLYRADRFKGQVEDLGQGVTGFWTMLNIQKFDETLGGALLVAIDQEPDSFNFFVAESNASKTMLNKMHLGLYTRSSDLELFPMLAEQMIIETHKDNEDVPVNHTRFTIDLRNDRYWTDDAPVTAEDVSFTFNYILESRLEGNPASEDLTDIVSIYSPSTYRVIFEFSTESYWHFEKFAYDYILPKHIFEEGSYTELGFEEWNDWNPIFNPADPSLTCGPFHMTDYEQDEFFELSFSPNWIASRYNYEFHFSDVSVSPADDFNSLFPFFTVTWDLVWTPDDYILPPTFDYEIFLDGAYFASQTWHYAYWAGGGPDSISIHIGDPYLFQGTHNVTIIVYTLFHGLELDTVMVTVQISMYQITPFVGFAIGCGLFGVIYLFVKMIREMVSPDIQKGLQIE